MDHKEECVEEIQQVEVALPTYDTAVRGNRILEELHELWEYRDLVRNLIKRNITARYKRSVLGIFWTLMDPLLTMVAMAVIYTALFARNIPAFPVFLLSGLIVWDFFSQSSAQAMADLMYSGQLAGRVYMPKSVFSAATVGTGLVNLLISLVVLVIFILIYQRPVTIAYLFLPVSLVIIMVFTFGVGLFMSAFAVFFADMISVYKILLRLLMFLSGTFYTLDLLPENLQKIINANPIYHLLALVREPLYMGEFPSPFSIGYSSICALICFVVGLYVFTRLSDRYAYRI
jgi:ABC-2 type transport system permease protein